VDIRRTGKQEEKLKIKMKNAKMGEVRSEKG